MKIVASLILSGLIAASAWAVPPGIDGRWKAEVKAKAEKERSRELTLDLKAEGDKLTGSVTRSSKRARAAEIENGKIDGNKFSFTTVFKGKKGERKVVWEGTLEGDQISGTQRADGHKRGVAFTAKKL